MFLNHRMREQIKEHVDPLIFFEMHFLFRLEGQSVHEYRKRHLFSIRASRLSQK